MQFCCGVAGHTCPRPCHADVDGRSHEAGRCSYIIPKTYLCSETPKHKFDRPCWQRVEQEPCPYEEELQCLRFARHKLFRKCGQTKEAVLSCCGKPCETQLACGHVCARKCSEPCMTESDCQVPRTFRCPEFPEKHGKITCPCSSSEAEIARNCKSRCSRKLKCGHFCPKKCGETCATTCDKPCKIKLMCGHLCAKKCSDQCSTEADCREPKPFDCPQFPDKHAKIVCPCNAAESEVARSCKSRCSRKLQCGHFCPKRCGEPCMQQSECQVLKPFDCPEFPEEHPKIICPCSASASEVRSNCKARCRQQLDCGHICPLTCGETCAATCDAPCETTLGCGHRCARKCSEPCMKEAECQVPKDFECPVFPQKHCKITLVCSSTTEEIAASCRDRCSRQLPCGHFCPNYCGEPCATVCEKRCGRQLRCGHSCSLKCHEACVCIDSFVPRCLGHFRCKSH